MVRACRRRWILVSLLGLAAGCPAPLPVHDEAWVLGQAARRWREFYPGAGDPDPARDVGLVRPRLGLPAITQAGAAFDVVVLERGHPPPVRAALVLGTLSAAAAARCLDGSAAAPGCWPLALERVAARRLDDRDAEEVHLRAQPAAPPPPGPYDFYLASPVDVPARARRAVWLRADDPAQLATVRVVHLNDLHLGKHVAHLDEHLAAVIADINRLHADLVLVAGDLANLGTDDDQMRAAAQLLTAVEAPVAAIVGNHDLGFDSFSRRAYGAGWPNFARAFHPLLAFSLTLGGWDLLVFDSGPSTFSPRILTRGLGPESVAFIAGALEEARAHQRRGVVLVSHAPTRATIAGDGPGPFGRMKAGAAALERLLLDAAGRGQRVVHLAGHTHWSDLLESVADGHGGLRFHRWRELSPCWRPVAGRALMITTQAAGHSGVTFKESAHGWGFTELELGDGAPRVAWHRYGLPDDPWVCREPI